MTEIESRGRKFALQVTSAFFLFLFVLCLVVRIKPQPKYQELAIRLDSVPVVKEKPKQSPVKKADTTKKETKSKSEQKTQEKPADQKQQTVKKTEKKAEPAKKAPTKAKEEPKKVEEPKIKKSVEELMAEQNSPKKKKVEFDESLFADTPEPVQTRESLAAKKVVAPKSSLSGSSAVADTKKDTGGAASSSSSSSDSAVSDATRQALSGIKSTSYSSTVTEGVKSKASVASSKSSTGAVSIQMSDGSTRQLLYPKNPAIYISEENARLIDSTRNVKITFSVKADGSVPFGEITIRPASLLPDPIQREIKMQISEWKFSEDSSGRTGIATFDYTLEIR